MHNVFKKTWCVNQWKGWMLFLWQTDYLAVTQPAHHLRWWHLPQLHRPTAVRCNREHLRKQLLISATVILQPSVFQQCLFHQSTEAEHTHMNPGSDHGLDFWVWKQPNVTDLTTPQHNPSYTECQDKMHWDAKSYLASLNTMWWAHDKTCCSALCCTSFLS